VRPGVEVGQIDHARQLVGEWRQPRQCLLVSRDDQDRPVYGGTPADFAVVQAIQEMKARGLRVTFYPFILMDVPPGNTLPNPYSDNAAETGQPAFPWRGRITCSPAAGYAGTVDKTATAASQVAALFGAATPASFSVSGESVSWTGPSGDWGLRRMVLHYAHLCAAAGGVDAFLIGTEMPGLTTIRSGASTYPAVQAYRDLLADVRSILGSGTKIGYAADWSEYFGHQPGDGSGDVFFHLDPLWADPEIDFVGIDNYMPLSDWRDGFEHADAAEGWPAIYDRAYLQGNIAGGEGFDWFYASAADARAGPHPDHRRCRGQAVGLPLQGSARLVVEPALRPPGRGGERHADGVGAAVQADLVHRARLSRHRPGHEPAQRLLRPEIVGELHAAFLARLAGRRHPARLSRGDVSLVGRGRRTTRSRRLRRPDGACARMRRLDLGRAALSVLSGADRRLDGRRELAARALADRAARRGVAGGPRPPPLPARGAAREPHRRHRPLGRGRGLRHHRAGKPARLDHHAVAALRLRRGGDRGRDPFRHARPGLRRHPRARRSCGGPRGRRAGTHPRPGDRTAAGAEMAGRARGRGLRRRLRRGAPHHRGHDADRLGVLPDGGAARGGRTPLPPRADGSLDRPRDGGVPPAALAAGARSGRRRPLAHDGRLVDLRLVSIADAEARGIEAVRQDRATYDLPPGDPRARR
jgi:hypothetical protein